VIRPLIHLPEETIAYAASSMELPMKDLKCPYGENSKRTAMEQLLKSIKKEAPQAEYSALSALKKTFWSD